MNREFLYRSQPALRRFLHLYAIDDDSVDMLKGVIPFGCMCGAALASPILFEFRHIWFIDVLIFFFSSAAFMLQHQEEIKEYGPFTLVAVTFMSIAAYSSARTTLTELVPWVPLALCLFVLLTVYFFSKLRHSLREDNQAQIAMEEGRAFHGTPVEPESVQSDEESQTLRWSQEMNRRLEFDISHTGGIDRPGYSEILSSRESDIDLDSNQSVARIIVQRMVSQSGQAVITSLLQTASADGFHNQNAAVVGFPNQWEQFEEHRHCSLLPGSIAVEGTSITSKDSEILG